MSRHQYLWWELARKFLELLQLFANIDLTLSIQQKRDDGLRTTSVLYSLRREEQIISRLMVVCAVFWYVGWCFARRVLEEKDDSIHGTELL